MHISLIYLYIFLNFFWLQTLRSQQAEIQFPQSSVKINPAHIQKYKQDPAFNYEPKIKKENFLTRIYNQFIHFIYLIVLKIFKFLFGIKAAGELLKNIIKIWPYILLLVLSYFVFKYFLGVDLIKLRKRKNIRMPQVYLTEEERILFEENLDMLIKEAIENKKHREAIRYYYLKVLKKLMDAQEINWRADKTNRDYLQELKNSTLLNSFKQITLIYDYIWYGKFPATEKELQEVEELSRNFQ